MTKVFLRAGGKKGHVEDGPPGLELFDKEDHKKSGNGMRYSD